MGVPHRGQPGPEVDDLPDHRLHLPISSGSPPESRAERWRASLGFASATFGLSFSPNGGKRGALAALTRLAS
jgi:hypothetical protein